jgi:hypothetical protein
VSQQLRHVTRLKATGLIEATLALSHAGQRCTRAALVHALTEEGGQEIAGLAGHLPPRTGGQERHSLALAFLRFLEHADFPVIATQPDECDAAAHLVVEGLIHGAVDEIGGDSAKTVIRGLTTSGRALLSPRMGKGAMERGRGSREAESRAGRGDVTVPDHSRGVSFFIIPLEVFACCSAPCSSKTVRHSGTA